jgi:hypothetical protein
MVQHQANMCILLFLNMCIYIKYMLILGPIAITYRTEGRCLKIQDICLGVVRHLF